MPLAFRMNEDVCVFVHHPPAGDEAAEELDDLLERRDSGALPKEPRLQAPQAHALIPARNSLRGAGKGACRCDPPAAAPHGESPWGARGVLPGGIARTHSSSVAPNAPIIRPMTP